MGWTIWPWAANPMGWTFVFHEFMQIKSGAFYPPSVDVVFFTVKINSYVQACISLQRLVSVAVLKWLGSRSPQRWQGLAAVPWPGPSILAFSPSGLFFAWRSKRKKAGKGNSGAPPPGFMDSFFSFN